MFEQMDLLDQLGYDDVWVTEHHFDEYGGTIPDPPVFLSALARTTSRIHLGVAVSVLPLRNPLQTAESYAMVDVISNGRLEFGLGRGSTPKEFEGLHIPRDDTGAVMRESLEVIRQAWSEDTVNFSGEPDVAGLVVVPVHGNRTLPAGTIASVLRQAGLTARRASAAPLAVTSCFEWRATA